MQKLEQKIFYTFNNIKLLKQALTHRSYTNNNNERLEFLGDSILGMIISAELFSKFPKEDEGKLTRMKSSLVRGLTLSEMAKEIDLSKYLILGIGERKIGGSLRNSILEDSMEAIFGAIYLDSGFEDAKKTILNLYKSRLSSMSPDIILKDDKSILQEYLQKYKKQLPSYELISSTGKDHNAVFEVKCTLLDYGISITQKAKSIKRAEHSCAKVLFPQIQK